MKNRTVTVPVTDFGKNGEGVGRADGLSVFVSGAVIGDVVNARITKEKKTYAYARAEEIVAPSPDRVTPACPVATRCGGCQIMSYDYAAQLRFKASLVKNALVRIGGFDRDAIERLVSPVLGMEDPYRYRNKAQYPFGMERNVIVYGFYATHSHRIVPSPDCLIGYEKNGAILSAIARYLARQKLRPYEEETGAGLLRHVLVRKGFSSGETFVCLIVNRAPTSQTVFPAQQTLIDALLSADDTIKSVCVNFNKKRGNAVLGAQTFALYGEPYLTDELMGLTFRISASSFFQINPVQTKRLYEAALDFAAFRGDETVWDLYCGIGTIALVMAANGAKQVYGVEIVADAVQDAIENAARNRIANATFIHGKAEEIGATLARPDVVVVDPPRKGLDQKLIDTILTARPKRVVYISCNPATLARDLISFRAGGFLPTRIQPVDLFPHSVHTEVVVRLDPA